MSDSVEKWDFYELSLTAASSGNPFLDVVIEAEFMQDHRSIKVAGFYDGNDVYRLRFMPDMEGTWRYVTSSNMKDLDGQKGEFQCVSPTGNNHGPVRVVDSCHFAYEDGTPYHPVGTTCYVWNLQGDEIEEQTLATLKDAPFNKMRMCVFPKRYAFNNNEPPCYPFEGEVKRAWDPAMRDNYRGEVPPDFWDFSRFNPEYFRRLEKRILDLRALGIEADLIVFHPYDFGAWGFDRMPTEVSDRYLKYLAARLSAFRNLWWSFANEYDLMFDLDLNDWDHFFKVIQAADPYQHLRSIHNCRPFYNHRKPWVTHCSVQHHDLQMVRTWLEEYGKPVVVDECGYEGDIGMAWGSLSAEAMVECFWLGFVVGGYVGHGETYWNPEEVLWWAKGGKLHGESPARIAFLRQIIEDVPAPGLFPLQLDELRKTFPEGVYKGMAGGRNGDDYLLIYQGRHQPRFRKINLPEGVSYRIDIIDTWNMTIDRFADAATGQVEVELPRMKYLAIRVVRNES
jgi:hypothetical protein